MKAKLFQKISILMISACAAAAAATSSGKWTEVFDSEEGRYTLNFDENQKKLDVTKLGTEGKAPSAVKIRIHRKHDRPLDLSLHVIELPNEPLRYTGSFDKWNGSVIGFEVDFSFDKKTWKKVKRFLGAKPR